jgi:hypothetical protein
MQVKCGHMSSFRGAATDLGFTRDRHVNLPRSAKADLGDREPGIQSLRVQPLDSGFARRSGSRPEMTGRAMTESP